MRIEQEKVYNTISKIPKGRVTTYKIIGQKLGAKGYRAIGQILNKNPYIPKVPCHRVVRSNGTLGGYIFGINKKRKLLAKEGIIIKKNRIINFNEAIFNLK